MPNKAKSKSQFRFFQAVKGGYAKDSDMTAEQADEMLGHQSPKGLPEKADAQSTQRNRQMRKVRKKAVMEG